MTLTGILSAFGAWLVGVVSKDALAFVWGLISQAWANYQAGQAVAQQAQADQTQLQNAKTPGDKTNAATAIDHDTFSGGGNS